MKPHFKKQLLSSHFICFLLVFVASLARPFDYAHADFEILARHFDRSFVVSRRLGLMDLDEADFDFVNFKPSY
jgi:hypothetical protein